MGDAKRKGHSSASGEKATPVKRQRVSRACDQCRAAREKCDGIQPICFTCASSNRSCSYTANPKKRGIQPGYIRTLELALASLLVNVPGCEQSLKSTLQDEKGQALLSGSDTEGSNKLHRKWRRNPVCKAIDGLLSGSGAEEAFAEASPIEDEDDEDDQPTQTIAEASILTPDSHVLPFSTFHPEINPNNLDQTQANSDRLNTTILTSRPSVSPNIIFDAFSKVHSKVKLPENIWRLFDVYFAYTHCWLPVVEKEYILKMSYSYPKDGLDIVPGSPGSGDHAELWSILAIASIQNAASNQSTGTRELLSSDHLSPIEIRNIARAMIPNERSTLETGHICAILLLSLIDIGAQNLAAAWMLVGHAIRGAVLLDNVSLSPTGSTSSADNQRRSSRVKPLLLACFVLDTLLSLQLSKSPYLRREQIRELGLLQEGGLDEWQPWAGCDGFVGEKGPAAPRSRSPMFSFSIFNHLVRLCSVVNGTLHREGQVASTEIKQGLLSWFSELPPNLRPVNLVDEEDTTPQGLNLFLAYSFARAVCRGSPMDLDPMVEARLTLERYTKTFGFAAMPPLFISYLEVFRVTDTSAANNFEALQSPVSLIWKQDQPLISESGERTPGSLLGHIKSPSLDTPRNFAYSPQQDFGLPNRQATANLSFNSFAPGNQVPQLDLHSSHSIYDGNYLERYNSSGSMDLDALFDDLTSLDGAERVDTQPQFMQNLGFGPNVNLADLLTSDFGQLDPLMNIYRDPGDMAYNPG
jgi:hypothetical protein